MKEEKKSKQTFLMKETTLELSPAPTVPATLEALIPLERKVPVVLPAPPDVEARDVVDGLLAVPRDGDESP